MYQFEITLKFHLHHLPTLNNNPPPSRQFSRNKMLLKKKTWRVKMIIEQIIEVESRVVGLLVVHVFPKLVIFMTKQKSSRENFRGNDLMLKNVAKSNVP